MSAQKVVHDFRDDLWGHSANIGKVMNGGINVEIPFGFGSGVRQGDFIIKKNGDDFATYRIDTIKYRADPRDSWEATATHTPGVFGVTDDGRIMEIQP